MLKITLTPLQMNRRRSTQQVGGRFYTLVRDSRIKDAKEQTKTFPDLSLPLLSRYISNYYDLKSDIKVQVGQTVFK